jgi:hypothetical protein
MMETLIPGRGFLHARSLILNDDQIKNLPPTPIDIVPVPASGRILIVNQFVFDYYRVGAYDNVFSGPLLQYSDQDPASNPSTKAILESAGPITRIFNVATVAQVLDLLYEVISSVDIHPDESLQVVAYSNDGNAFGLGDPLNVLKASVTYYIYNTNTQRYE